MKSKLITAIFVLSTLVIGCKKYNPEQLKIGAMAGPETALVPESLSPFFPSGQRRESPP